MSHSQEITRVLARVGQGDRNALDELIPLIYDDLRKIAQNRLRQGDGDTLQATAVVNEFYMRFLKDVEGGNHLEWQNRTHFFAVSAKVMRRILVDYARQKQADKRAGNQRITLFSLEEEAQPRELSIEQLLTVDQAVAKLARFDPDMHEIVEMRFFAGLTVEEIAEVKGCTPRTVKRKWAAAKLWMTSELVERGNL